jgi:hypothetical protein
MTTVFMVDLKRFHFAYDRPAVLPRSTDRETVFNLGRSFFGCIMWSKQDAFQIQYGVDANAFPTWSLPPVISRLYQPPLTNSISGETCSSFFSKVSPYPIQYSPAQADPS